MMQMFVSAVKHYRRFGDMPGFLALVKLLRRAFSRLRLLGLGQLRVIIEFRLGGASDFDCLVVL